MSSAQHSRVRQQLFEQLAQLERAGIAPIQALHLALRSLPRVLHRPLSDCLRRVQRGMPLAQAGASAGLFGRFEAALIRLGEDSGRLESVLRHLAEAHGRRARRLGQLRSRLALPLGVLVLGALVQPLPLLFRSEAGLSAYLVQGPGFIVLVLVALWAVGQGAAWLCAQGWRWPWLPPLWRDVQRCALLDRLALALESGLPAASALPLALEALFDARLYRDLAAGQAALESGMALNLVLNPALPPRWATLVTTGEHSGRMAQALRDVVRLWGEELEQRIDTRFRLLPWLCYALVLLLLLSRA